ncbi:MAG: DUF58 domain-containing protein [Actinomycetia bacterium]|nr:DUF58 domain-containing protein [Actinomycetes bacterium]
MTRRSTVRLPLAVVVTAMAAVSAITSGRPELALLAAPWAVLLVLGLVSTRPGQTRATVALDTNRVLVGDEVEIEVVVEGPIDGWVEAKPVPAPSFWPRGPCDSDRPVTPQADVMTPGRPVTLRCSLTATEWGSHDLGRVQLTVRQTYGLIQWSGTTTGQRWLRVHPTPMDLRRLVAPWLVRRLTGTHYSAEADRGIEYADIRPFVAGDSQRDINWRISARSGELWVSQRHPERATDVVLLLDSFVEAGHDVRSVVGLAIEAAIALAESHLARTDRIGLVELGGVVRWVVPAAGQLQLQRLADALLTTGLHANASDRDLSIVPRRALPARSFVVALSPLLDTRFIDALFELRGAGHDVVVIDCMAHGDPAVPARSEASAVARRMWQAERTMVRDRLATHGIAVGRWVPGNHLDVVLADLTRWRSRGRGIRR